MDEFFFQFPLLGFLLCIFMVIERGDEHE